MSDSIEITIYRNLISLASLDSFPRGEAIQVLLSFIVVGLTVKNARSEATWQTPGRLLQICTQYQEIATALRPRNDSG